ncbi:calcium-binding protein [Ruegeria halocynthiae]|uniref:calcium-binding protein n=1 Tax=Ruegeria halocynthiae TaxID=985054 RepID=UPI00068E0E91|nr:calcium-binding protein [Ruegeria halocynthiae]
MVSYSYELTPGEVSETVSEDHFGANFRGMFPNIGEAFDMLGVTHLRYPSGSAQEENITSLLDGQLNDKLAEFLDWVVERGTTFTLSIPVGEELASQSEMTAFVNAVYEQLGSDGHLLTTIEISNEYWGFQEASEYGKDAALAAEYLSNSYEAYNVENPTADYDPKILVQTAPPWHVGSGSTMDQKNKEIIEHFDANKDLSDGFQPTVASEAVDGVVSHYYFNESYGEDNTFSDGYYENREIGSRPDMWYKYFEQELDYHVTEWNVQNVNITQQGLKAASVILEMFETMLESGVDAAEIWSVLNRNYNSFAGGITEDSRVHPSPAGQVFSWMRESLVDEDGVGLSLMGLGGLPDNHRPIEVNAFTGDGKTVLYVSNRTEEFGVSVDLDLDQLVQGKHHVSVRKLGVLDGSADGLSDRAEYDDNGRLVPNSRNQLRVIDEAEKLALEAKFQNLFALEVISPRKISSYEEGTYRTYLPPPSTILLKPGYTPETATSFDHYYFAGETDVTVDVEEFTFDDASDVDLELDPYEVVEITITPYEQVVGSENDDTIVGSESHEEIQGDDGNDYIEGGGGTDYVSGGDGNDFLVGGVDDAFGDSLLGGTGNDTVNGGQGADEIYGGEGDDRLFGGDGEDEILGENGSDYVDGGADDDRLDGGSGQDVIMGGQGDDHINGGADDDVLIGGVGNDTLAGGDGTDILEGSAGDDILDGGRGDDLLIGGEGADVFVFRPGEGIDSAYDFELGVDVVWIDATDASYDNLTLIEHGNSTLVELDDVPIAILGVSPGALISDDFQFI